MRPRSDPTTTWRGSGATSSRFSLLQDPDGAAQLAARLERLLADGRTKATLGWAAFPQEGDNALALYRAASERLYARKVMRSYLRPVPEPVEAVGLDERQLGVGLLDHRRVVRRADDCDSPFARDAREELADRERVRVVEAGGRLVREQELGLGGERAGDRDALLLARREPRDTLFRELLEPDDRERLARLAVAAVEPAQAEESSTFSRTLRNGTSGGSWATSASRSGGTRRGCALSSSSMRSPSTTISPALGRSRPASMCSSVVLPEPDGPVTTVRRPGWIAALRPERTVRSPVA